MKVNFIVKKIRIWVLLNFLTKIWSFHNKIKVEIVNLEHTFSNIYFHLRWKIYKEEGYIDSNDFPEQQLRDGYDERSLNLLAFKKNIPVGSARFIPPSDLGLPTEKAFNLIDLNCPKKEIGEISKLCIEKDYRKTKTGKKIFLMLMAEMYKFMKKNKIKYALIGIPPSLKKSFEKVDFQHHIKELAVGPLKSENIEERKTAKKYFEKFKITPYLITII